MDFRILGPLDVRTGEGEVCAFTRRQQRVLLAMLLLQPNKAVSTDRIVEALWPERPPASALQNLHSYISVLRRQLDNDPASPGTGSRIRTRPGGYTLRVEPGELDAEVFETLAAQGDRAVEGGDHGLAVERFTQALGLWRADTVLEGLELSGALQVETARLEELRTLVVESAYEARLEMGRHRELVPELEVATERHPLRERFWAQRMLALYRSERQADALACYQRVRAVLADQLGIDPGPELQQLQQRILRADPVLDATAAPVRSRAVRAQAVRPAQLPADLSTFAGRDNELNSLAELVHRGAVAAPSPTHSSAMSAMVICTISGTAGIGKTALAIHAAHQLVDRFPDGQLYVNLRGFDPSGQVLESADALRGFLDAFGVPPERIPVDRDAQAGLYRSMLADKRVLVVLDNAGGADQVRPLLPGSPGCLVLVTSRNDLSGLVTKEGASPLTLELLTTTEAQQLLERRLGPDRIAAEPIAARHIIAACARLPLALAIVAARAAVRPRFSLEALVADLLGTHPNLDAFTTTDADVDVRTVFSWSYEQLTPEAARLFRLLGLHPGPDFSGPASAALAGIPPDQANRLLAELTHAHLLGEPTPGRYGFHDLLRAYATELAHARDPDTERRAAERRMLDHYLHTAFAAARLLDPGRDPITLIPHGDGVTPERFADDRQALTWFTTEHRILLAVVDHSANTGYDNHTWQLAWAFADFLNRQGHWHDGYAIARSAADAAQRSSDQHTQARVQRILARACIQLGHLDDAQTHLRHALELSSELGDRTGEAHTLQTLCRVSEQQRDYEQALAHARRALELYRELGHQAGLAGMLNAIGWYHTLLEAHQQALIYCRQAIELLKELGNRVGEAAAWDSLGYAHHHLGQYEEAAGCYRQALELCRDVDVRYNEGATLTHLGETLWAAGDQEAARRTWRQALEILDEIGHHDVDTVRAKLRRLDHANPDGNARPESVGPPP